MSKSYTCVMGKQEDGVVVLPKRRKRLGSPIAALRQAFSKFLHKYIAEEEQPIPDPSENDYIDIDSNVLSLLMDNSTYMMRKLNDGENRGQAIIFNHTFNDHPVLAPRWGTNQDLDALLILFSHWHFKVQVMMDLTVREIKSALLEVSCEDHTLHDLLMVVVLTHGDEDCLHANDGSYRPKELWLPFADHLCPSLREKPKLFIIQACRGSSIDHGHEIHAQPGQKGKENSSKNSTTWPSNKSPKSKAKAGHIGDSSGWFVEQLTQPDVHVSYPTMSGYYSFRNTGSGSIFVQTLCSIVMNASHPIEYQKLMSIVSRNIAIEYEAKHVDEKIDGGKQLPNSQSTLCKELYIPID